MIVLEQCQPLTISLKKIKVKYNGMHLARVSEDARMECYLRKGSLKRKGPRLTYASIMTARRLYTRNSAADSFGSSGSAGASVEGVGTALSPDDCGGGGACWSAFPFSINGDAMVAICLAWTFSADTRVRNNAETLCVCV